MSFNPLEHTRVLKEDVSGFFRGVVRDNCDPRNLGRVKVEVLPIMKGVETEHLPWAEKAANFIPPVNSWVWVFFDNGEIYKPVYFAPASPVLIEDELAPIAEKRNYPLVTGNEAGKTHQDMTAWKKEAEAISSVENSSRIHSSEPAVSRKHDYPANKIYRFTSGIVVEIYDKEGESRIHVYHPSGTYIEVNKNGLVHLHSKGELCVYSEDSIQIYSNSLVHINPLE